MRAQAILLLLTILAAVPARAQVVRDDFYITNGTVNAAVLSGSTLYVGGQFTSVGPVTGSGVPLDAVTGLAVPGFPKVNGDVLAVAADGVGGWFIGGLFTSVGGQPRSNLAHVLADQSVSSWDPGANNAVRALAVSGGTVYAGGDFTSAGGQTRNRIAALDTATGAARAWNPNANSTVRVIVETGGLLYAGGAFTTIGGQGRSRIAALDTTTGLATAWNPNSNSTVLALAPNGATLMVGGQFTAIGAQSRNRLAELNLVTGFATGWNPNANNLVTTVVVDGGTVYAGGTFTTVGGQTRNRIAALDGTTGLATAWNPNASAQVSALVLSGTTVYAGGDFLTIGGAARSRLAALDVTTGLASVWDPTAYGPVVSLALQSGTVYAGGSFVGMGGVVRSNLAAFDVSTGTATGWDPNADNQVLALTVAGSTVYVGGTFAHVGGEARASVAALDAATGLATPWNPGTNGEVSALLVDGSSVFAGGNFTNAAGQARGNLAEIDVASGLATPWNPNANGQIFVLARGAGPVFAGGTFTNIGGLARNSVAALDRVTGFATTWNANANGTVRALVLRCNLIYVGGFFTSIGGQARNRVAALDAGTAAANSWNPNSSGPVFALEPHDGRLYVGGVFAIIGGQGRNSIAALDPVTGLATAWNPNSTGTVRTLAVGADEAYAGGSFTRMGGLQVANLAAMDDDLFTCPAIALGPPVLPDGLVGTPYAQTVPASGGTAPYCYAVSLGSLPAGLSLVASTGAITGTPGAAGTSVFTIRATDARGCTGSTGYVVSVFETPPTSLVAANTSGLCISPAHPCVAVPVEYTRTDSTPARAVSVTLQLDVTKLGLCVPGTPAANFHPGAWLSGFPNTQFQVIDHGGGAYTVDQALLGTPCGPTSGGQLFTIDLASTGPDGNGAITVLAVRVRDCDGAVIPAAPGAVGQLAILNTPIPVLPDSLPGAISGIAYSQALSAGAGVAPYTWALTAGALPPGLTLSTAGVISGAPTALGAFAFTAGVTDVNDCVGSREYTLQVTCGTLAVQPIALADGVLGNVYAQTLAATGGIPPLTWSVSSGTLPAGLALEAASGAISGTPEASGTSTFTVAVTDSNGCTGSTAYVVSVFETAPTSLVSANTTGLCISPGHPCVAVPVEYARTDSAEARAISVTLQLDVTKLALCVPGTPAANFHAGTWLSGFPNAHFQVIDHGGGAYTVDQALLGSPCGVTTGGQLFTVDLAATGPDGSGAITVLAVKARGCDGAVLPVAPGPPAAITLSSVGPAAITDLASAQVLSGNGPGGTTGIVVTWSTGGSGPVSLYRAPFGSYPEYDDPGPVSPPDPNASPGGPWTLVSASATSGVVDQPPGRGFWHYTARVIGECDVPSLASNLSNGSLNYHLGDVSDGATAGQGDNAVRSEDVSLLGAHYGLTGAAIAIQGVAYLDVGPTTDSQPTSRPTTDDKIDMDDLALFSINFQAVSEPSLAAKPARSRPAHAERTGGAANEFRVVAPSLVEEGEVVTAEVWLKGTGTIQVFSARLAWDRTVVEAEGMESGQWVEGQGGLVLSPGLGVVDAALLGVGAEGLVGEGRVARVRFRVLRTGDAAIRLASLDARDATNRRLPESSLGTRVESQAPGRTALLAPWPNPVRGTDHAALEYSLAERGAVELAIFGVDGRRVRVLVREERAAGVYREGWDGRDESGHASASGVYYARLVAGGRQFRQKLVRIH